MNSLKIDKIASIINNKIEITGSKSESNRLLILKQFYPDIQIKNLSNSDDTVFLQKALAEKTSVVNIGPAGTAMRFLTAYFAAKPDTRVTLTGSKRMLERPIEILVEALNSLGAEIAYKGLAGYPPLQIKGKTLKQHKVSIQGNISSQYISALLLIAPKLKNGLELRFTSEVTSVPYIKMTLQMLSDIGVQNDWSNDTIKVWPKSTVAPIEYIVESDWSAASYFYSMVALCPDAMINLSFYKKSSLQGDSVLAEIYKNLGVSTVFLENGIELHNNGLVDSNALNGLDLSGAPDIAQTIAVTCLGLGIPCFLKGLHTLKIKETDRLVALKNEMERLGAEVKITGSSLELKACNKLSKDVRIETYEDHRMAMSFAPLALKTSLEILEPDVVSKSYPLFWEDFNKIIGKN